MNERTHKLEAIFHAALELGTPEQRAAYLNQACADDTAMRREVEELLRASTGAEAVFQKCQRAHGGAESAADEPALDQVGSFIGRYKLLQEIGQGGCGLVYMAEQYDPVRRRVALKVIKLGMDTKSVVGRFESERQALAMMDHPNIAKVLDAGATGVGRPFFVMELVRGRKITQYCDEQKLSTPQRLDLFIQVCQAVQHAHQKGIIHRDIKPSNILVTERDGLPVPKVIDFGIAKATGDLELTDKTVFTAFEQFIGTPAYMSPEQARLGELDIDTRSDIYTLGVLLYELLTGQPPFDAAHMRRLAMDEVLKTIREKNPPRPSTRVTAMTETELTNAAQCRQLEPAVLPRLLRGDLDWIVMKCLEKDRTRRYETANGLAMDIQRHLNNEPVLARPASNFYRSQKFVQRHKATFLAIVIVAVTLLAGLSLSTTLWRSAKREATHALSAEADAKEKLRSSYLAQAQAGRWSKRPGRRFDGLELLKQAAAIHPSLELRNEAIACMALVDLRKIKELDLVSSEVGFDATYERYVFADVKGTIHVRRVEDESEVAQFPGYNPPFWYLEFSPNGRFLFIASGTNGDRVEIRDLAEKRILLKLPEPYFRTLGFSADSRFVAVAYISESNHWPIRILDLQSSLQVASVSHESLPYYVRFNPQQPNLLLTSDKSKLVRVWDWRAGKVVQSFLHTNWVTGICWNPDGNAVATGCADFKVRLWDLATGNQQLDLSGHEREVTQVTFTCDGAMLASSGWEGRVFLWDVRTGREILDLSAPGELSNFSQPGRKLGFRMGAGKFAIVEASDGCGYRSLLPDKSNDRSVNCDFSPDSHLLVATDTAGLSLWDVSTGTLLLRRTLDQGYGFAMFHPNGTNLFLATRDTLEEWSLSGAFPRIPSNLALRRQRSLAPGSAPFALARDGNTLATSVDGVIHIFETLGGLERRRMPGQNDEFAALSADGRLIATWANMDSSSYLRACTNVDVWEAATAKLLRRIPASSSIYAAFSPNNRWLAIGDEVQFRLWDVGTWQPRYTFGREWAGFYGFLAFSPDSAMLAVAISQSDVQLREAATGRELAMLKAPEPSQIAWITFNGNGTQLAVACSSGAIQLWDLRLIRQQLAAMNLDWDLPAYRPPVPSLRNP